MNFYRNRGTQIPRRTKRRIYIYIYKKNFKNSSSGTYKYSLVVPDEKSNLRRNAEQIPVSGQKLVEFSSRECRFYSH